MSEISDSDSEFSVSVSFIDETAEVDINSTTIMEGDESSHLSVRRSSRESRMFPVKKKPARVLDSDSDANESITADNTSTNLLENTNQARDDSTLLESADESADIFSSISEVNNKPSTSSKSISNISKRACSTRIPESDSGCDDQTKKISAESDSDYEEEEIDASHSSEKSEHVQIDDESDDNVSLSPKIRNARISQQFQYNSEGILHSTAIHAGNQDKPSDSVVEIVSDHDSDIIEVSSDEGMLSPKKTPFKLQKIKKAARQQTLHSFIIKNEVETPQPKKPVRVIQQPLSEIQPINQQVAEPKVTVSLTEYETQLSKVRILESAYVQLQGMIETINYEALPDKGRLIQERLENAETRYMQEKSKLEKMEKSDTKVDDAPKGAFANVAWEDIEAGANAVQPKTFGKQAMSTYNAQKAVTLDRLQQLHEALQTCPKEGDLEDDPAGIKVPLMPHQKRALAWALFREKEKPSGGILADDMGLGKTLTMLSLVIKCLQLEKNNDNSDEENEYVGKNKKYDGGTLIVCPASLINQWSGEIDRHLKRGLVSYNLYHGPNREKYPKMLAEYDIVITTYAIVSNEAEKQSAAFRIKWRRVILDEAHTIRNHKTLTSEACCQLRARSRWALTGTPMHNKELDMYALLKFLRCSPFDDLQVWKRWVGDKSAGGLERLHTVISSLMLRRTKIELMEKGALNCMPEKKWELVRVELDKNEQHVYHKVLIFSQTLFAQFLHQRAEKNQDFIDHKFTGVPSQAPNQEYFKMRQRLLKLNKVKEVNQHEILVLLLRLRQICCHPSLITAMLDESRGDIGEGDEECEQLNLLDQLEKLNIEDEAEDEFHPADPSPEVAEGLSQETRITLKEASKGHLRPSDPVFAKERASSKIKAVLKVLKERVISKNEKAIIVSQWSSYLKLVALHLMNYGIEFDQLDGQVPVNKRMAMVDRLNNPKDRMRVLLLSLTAGGVGLNLVGANHLLLLDLHWNPQLENQAQDRIYRVGQTKPVFVYKFMATDTIEERIKALQDKKLAMAEGLLTGTKQATQAKLSLQDLRMIFGM